jgi:hypothetical protein
MMKSLRRFFFPQSAIHNPQLFHPHPSPLPEGEGIGVDNLIWGNDYPHHDSIWPHSQEVLDRIFQGVPANEKYKMTCGNVCKLYGITLPPELALIALQ